jgi:hypothetical protein
LYLVVPVNSAACCRGQEHGTGHHFQPSPFKSRRHVMESMHDSLFQTLFLRDKQTNYVLGLYEWNCFGQLVLNAAQD